MPNPGINGWYTPSKYGWFIIALLTFWDLYNGICIIYPLVNIQKMMEHHHF